MGLRCRYVYLIYLVIAGSCCILSSRNHPKLRVGVFFLFSGGGFASSVAASLKKKMADSRWFGVSPEIGARCGVHLLALRIDFENAEGNLGFANESWLKRNQQFDQHPWDWYTFTYIYIVEFYGRCIGKYTTHGWLGLKKTSSDLFVCLFL